MKHEIRVYGPAALLVLLAFVVAYQFIKPAPPKYVRIASGGTEGAYHVFAQAYARELAREGINLEVVSTAGSVENQRLLRQGEVDVALVQGGIPVDTEPQAHKLYSLGSLYYEPLWLFVRRGADYRNLGSLRGTRVNAGEQDSGTRALALRLLQENDVLEQNTELLALDDQTAAGYLHRGEIDAALFVASPDSPLVQKLLRDPGLSLVSFERAEAYARRHRFLTGVTLPQGVVDLRTNLPASDIRLLAPTANLVVSENTHPAISELLLQGVQRVHGEGDWFSGRDEFPQPDLLAYPLAKEAERYYRHGPPLLQRFLPFWAASLVDRLKVMLLPLVLMLLPFFKVMPPIYQWRMGAKIYHWYDDLEDLEAEIATASVARRKALAERLDRIEEEVRQISVPASYGRLQYHLRQHIEFVRARLQDPPRETGKDSDLA